MQARPGKARAHIVENTEIMFSLFVPITFAMCIGTEWSGRTNGTSYFHSIYLFLMFSLFTLRPSPARSPLYAIHVVHNVRELSGKLVKSFRVFLFSISFLMLVYFVSIEGERGDDRGV